MPKQKRTWQIQEAKNRLSELVDEARRSGPQIVTRRGVEAAVVLSFDDYTKLTRTRGRSLVDVILSAPKVPGGLRIERSRDTGREIDLE